MVKDYYLLAKPGIVFGNATTVTAGFILASRGHINFWLFLATLVGLSLVIASACVCNNYIDRWADAKMTRTKNRALVRGVISLRNAILFAVILGVLGLFILGLFTNLLTVVMAASGFIIYVFLYSFWKYRTTYATEIGSFAGGVPPVVGYCAVSNCFDAGALIVFLIITLWQMPHFFAIAIYRCHDYVAASIPILPAKRGAHITKMRMLVYIGAFTIATLMLTVFGYAGYAYLTAAVVLGLTWGWLCIKGFRVDNDQRWARKMFLLSLIVVTVLSVFISIDAT